MSPRELTRRGLAPGVPIIAITLDELLAWTEEERTKWEGWFAAHPEALAIPLRGDKFGTVGGLIGHIFEAEWRQAHRFGGGPVPERKDPIGLEGKALFEYGRSTRAFFRTEAAKLAERDWTGAIAFTTVSGPVELTRRKLALHLMFHETRHWAQIARAVREHEVAPPGKHDLMFSQIVK